MTDLPVSDRSQLMEVVFAVESALRETLAPHKINLASLGNMTPHLHWHVIPRSPDDPHFPEAVWAAPRREPTAHASDALTARLIAALGARLR
jgi:diadenosine tetraphosphate (Ap4A) HIT family hydrolase